MAAVVTLATWRVRPGRLQDFMAVVARGKKIATRLKGNVRVWGTRFGAEPGTVSVAIEVPDARAFGEYLANLEADPEWQALVAEFTAHGDPPADLLHQGVASELPVG